MSSAFENIKRGLKEAIARVSGNKTVETVDEIDVPETDIPAEPKPSQAESAKNIDDEEAALPDWERRRQALTTQVVAAYIGNNAVSDAELPDLVKNVYAAVADTVEGPAKESAKKPKPAEPIADR